MSNILIVAAHPDDEVLGCAGTTVRLTSEGHDVFTVILGEGVTSRSLRRDESDQRLVGELQAKSRQVAELFGIKELFMYGFPDNRFDTVPLLDIIKVVEEVIDQTQPEVIYTHHGGDLNIDHDIIFRATLTATRPVAECPVKELYAYEVPSSTDWAFGNFRSSFRPNVFVDITDTLEKKIKAMEIYDSEIRSYPHPRSRETLQANARRWGSIAGCGAAEAFELVRAVRPEL